MKSPSASFYFSGDTAYEPTMFKLIGEKYGPFDIAAIGIGAYKPRFFMKDSHVNPLEAVKIHKDVKSRQSCGIHWGTFPLGFEDNVEPALDLARAREIEGLKHSDFFTMEHGETILVSPGNSNGGLDLAHNNPDILKHFLAQPRDPNSDE